ncbi:hypothetical protein N658DRAFT_338758 [Parathielavia hyrcaniae]|uniref:Uncharacterized protein n=1 Tax=Parathielavia hyrcaniae TaxID=113614 RepID=A0AAN6T390_9PEZI|nr:hypothetical protein N658DRAFT_338758 [Parathielavia hyrcaniae]
MLPTAPTLADAETGKTPILLPPKGTSSTAKAQYVDSSAQAGTSRANYVDNSTQTEPAACLSRLNSEDQLTSRSHLFKDTDLESPNPAGFPLWVNKVPNPADGSSVSLHKAGLGTCDSSFSNRRWDDETLKSRSKLLKQRLEYLALQLEASKMHWQQRRERERSQDSRPLSPTTPTT